MVIFKLMTILVLGVGVSFMQGLLFGYVFGAWGGILSFPVGVYIGIKMMRSMTIIMRTSK